jgi:ubiquinone biosynthesis protein COQ9
MSDSIRDRVLLEALPEIARTGISQATLEKAAEKAKIGKRELQDSFPQGPVSLVEAFSHWADRRMADDLATQGKLRMRERITAVVRARLETLGPHKEAVRHVTAFLAQPQHAALAAQLMMRSVDAMWRACGDRSSDFSYYTKRATLAAVYGATFAYWLSDASEGHAATWAFLDQRIDNVMSFEKFKVTVKETIAKLPDPRELFNALRGRSG